MKKLTQSGFNLVEMVIAVGITAVLASSVIMARSFMAKQSVATNDKAYAAQKAIQMFEELKALVGGSEQGVNILDNYSNGSAYDTVLTTDKTIDTGLATANPGNPVSGNRATNSHWRYLRQVQVNHVANDPYIRQVIIKVYLYGSDAAPTSPGTLLAEVGGQLMTLASVYPPSQVMDVYVLAINNVAAWWAQEWSLYDTFQQIIADIQGRNPGLVIRPHYITRTSYGRDPLYVPYINNNLTTASATNGGAVSYVYFYPGNTPEDSADGSGAGQFYDPVATDPGFVGLTGNFNVDGNLTPTTLQFTNCPSYSVADMYNNAMRYPDELSLYNAVTAAAVTASNVLASDSVTEISERMLFENLLDNSTNFNNALIVNLHGECLPLPSMRNYSDAAKDPGSQDSGSDSGDSATNVRVVTHPELLYYPPATASVASVTVRLRVYAYYDGLDNIDTLDNTVSMAATTDPKVPAISLFFPDVTQGVNTGVVGVTAIIGSATGSTDGVNNKPTTYQYDPFTVPYASTGNAGTYAGVANVDSPGSPVEMNISYVGPYNQMLITLYNTRLRCESGPTTSTSNGGVSEMDRLYGLEYIPCSPDVTSAPTYSTSYPFYTFTGQDLTNTGGGGTPKNTARWILTLALPVTTVITPASGTTFIYESQPATQSYTSSVTFIGQHTIETRIGAGMAGWSSAGTVNKCSENLSRTWVWNGWTVPPPTTEQYQYLGDPRHEPYLDTKVGGWGNGQGTTIAANGYNWWFKDGASNLTGAATCAAMYSDGYKGFGQAGDTTGTLQNQSNQTHGGWWGSDGNFVDLPRFYQTIRQGLLNSTGIWTTMNGYTYYYYGMGGEFGSDQPPFSDGLTINSTLYSTTAQTGVSNVCEMIPYSDAGNGTTIINLHVPANTTNTWYAKTWMGELFPDSIWGTWKSTGNLPVAGAVASTSTFYREAYGSIPATLASSGTTAISNSGGYSLNGFGRNITNRAGPDGCTAFYDGTGTGTLTSGGSMNHDSVSGTDTASGLAATCYSIFEYPLAPAIVNSDGDFRPWHLSDGQRSPEWNIAPYSTHTSLTVPSVGTTFRIFYTSDAGSDWQGTGVVQITGTSSSGATQNAYVMESGLAISANIGTAELGKTALVTMLRSYLDGGNYSGSAHIVQVPLVALYCDSPTAQYSQPSTINLVIDGPVTSGNSEVIQGVTIISGPASNIWYRFQGVTSTEANIYTEEYPGYPNLTSSTYTETYAGQPLTIDMNILYSPNADKNWYYIQNNVGATPGTLATSPVTVLLQSNSFPVTYTWSVPSASWPQGNYDVMVEAFRDAYPLDYAYHELTITIDR